MKAGPHQAGRAAKDLFCSGRGGTGDTGKPHRPLKQQNGSFWPAFALRRQTLTGSQDDIPRGGWGILTGASPLLSDI